MVRVKIQNLDDRFDSLEHQLRSFITDNNQRMDEMQLEMQQLHQEKQQNMGQNFDILDSL